MSSIGAVPAAITQYKVFGPYTFTAGGLVQFAHGFGKAPVLVTAFATCLVAEYGFAVGDTVELTLSNNSSAATTKSNTVWFDPSNVYLRWTDQINPFRAARKDTGVSKNLTAANWEYSLRVFG